MIHDAHVAAAASRRPKRKGQRTVLLFGAILAIASVGLAACSSGSTSDGGTAASSGDINIAVVADLTGAAAATNATAADGIKSAIDAANAAGGSDGRKFVLTTYDSASTPDQAQVAARQAVADEPSLIAYAALSSGLVASSTVFAQANIPVISVSAAEELLTPTLQPWYFTVGSTPAQIAEGFLDVARQNLGTVEGKRFAFNGLDSSTTNSIFAHTKEVFEEAGAQFVDQEKSVGAITSYTAQAQKIVGLNVDGVISTDLVENFVIVGQALIAAGFNGPYIGTEGASADSVFKRFATPQYLGGRSYLPVVNSPEIVAAAKTSGVEPSGVYFPFGWAIGTLAVDAAANCSGACSSDDMTAALQGVGSFTPPGDITFGPLSFSEDKHNAVSTIQYFQWDATKGAPVDYGSQIKVD